MRRHWAAPRPNRRHEIIGWILCALVVVGVVGLAVAAQYFKAWLFWSAAP